jgi:hypothetical protein
VDHHFALATIFEIMEVASRADLKSDLLKELERHRSQLMGYRGNPAHSEAALDEVIGRIDRAFTGLNQLQGKAGPGAGRQRLADEHPQPHQHSRRHLRVRPAVLLRLAAAHARAAPRRPGRLGRPR